MEENLTNEKENKKSIKSEIMEWIICLIIAGALYLIINYFFGTLSGIKQTSMTPTFVEGEKILIQRTILFKRNLKYGDIVTFVQPNQDYEFETSNSVNITGNLIQGEEAIARYSKKNILSSFIYDFVGIGKISYIKRVIGLEGDHIVIESDGTVTRNGETIEEPYIKDGITSRNGIYINVIVPEGTVFVMGDNRLESMDSRILGCIPLEKIDGYVRAKVWPFSKFESYK